MGILVIIVGLLIVSPFIWFGGVALLLVGNMVVEWVKELAK